MGAEQYKSREEWVYESLKSDILDLRLKPGQLLKEAEICEKFGVSRTPVRDAIRLLQEQGFVKNVPYQGVYVTLLSLNYIKQMIYMRVAVETSVLRDFTLTASGLVLEDIRYLIRKQEALVQEPGFSPEQFYRIDSQMHAVWFEATKRTVLWDMLQKQDLYYTRFRMLDFTTETDFSRIIKEHKELLTCIEQKDFKRIEEVLKDHLYYSMKRMRHQIDVEYRDYFEEEPEDGKFDI
ncbi:MAG: GntR family transcriptional regulator [Lachnospiraceae bacterium]|nr:GntR family transcriptional regulator [Lachnospiraceae bacterium]